MTLRVWDLDAGAYARHALHRGDRAWPEANCYVDLWVELLHAAGAEPLAALPFTLGIDVQGDQWTFFKFPPADLELLYGVDVFELNIWLASARSHLRAAGAGPPRHRRGQTPSTCRTPREPRTGSSM